MDLNTFRQAIQSNMMVLEEILAEVYLQAVADHTNFALFDGGAHKGYHTTRMAKIPGCSKVYAVEADPYMCTFLENNLSDQLGSNTPEIEIVRAALQANPAVTTIPWKSSSSHVGRSSIVAANEERPTIWHENSDIVYREKMNVAATTIDIVLYDEDRLVPFAKLDLEGADLYALQGAWRTLKEKRPIVAFENSIHAPNVHGFKIEDMANYFERLDYVPMNFLGEPISPENWFGFFEAWAVPRDRAEWLSRTVRDACVRSLETLA